MKRKILSLLAASMMLTACSAAPAPTDTPATLPADISSQVQFEELILVDNENCSFKITSIEKDHLLGYTLKATLENKTDLELMFTLDGVSVNSFMCDPFWAVTVTPGMKAKEEISFSDSDFDRNGISEVTDITFTLRIYDNNDWMADSLVEEDFTIYPLGEEEVNPFIREPQEGELVLFEDENCAIIVTGFDPDNIWGYTVNVYLENKTDKNLMFSLDGAAVNGFMCDPFWAEEVAPGKRSNSGISWSSSDFEDNGITELESITLPFRVYDAEDWMDDDILYETFTLNP
ncbi:MAG: hypothetical protein IKJ99_06410 [Oscillospiraceae bacterium]|nr:hypothetical protein [Oscillospiraceae bacterium]